MTSPATQSVPSADVNGASEVIVRVDGVSKVFRIRGSRPGTHEHLTAVNDVSLTVKAGQSLGIVGESGSGKTTLARMIIGLEKPTSGTIDVAGMRIDGKPRSRKGRLARGEMVQMVYQDPYSSLDPRQTVGEGIDEVLRVCLRLDGLERNRRVMAILEQVGLNRAVANSRPDSLSGGQRQRVAIARALVREPSLLVLDEAVSALDVSVQGQILNLLSDLREQNGLTYLFVSHDLAVIQQLCDRVIVMNRGSVVEQGVTAEVLSAPQHAYTKRLIGAIPTVGWKPRQHPDTTLA